MGGGAAEIDGIPMHDGADDQIEAFSAINFEFAGQNNKLRQWFRATNCKRPNLLGLWDSIDTVCLPDHDNSVARHTSGHWRLRDGTCSRLNPGENAMLHLTDQNNYSPDEWDLMQRAHDRASEMLHRGPKTHENADRLARTVMKLFGQGLRDEDILASKATNHEVGCHFVAPRFVGIVTRAA
jgi:hypothetical protein